MRSSNATNTILFEERKKQINDQKIDMHKKSQVRNSTVVSLSSYKKTKKKKEHVKFNVNEKNKKLVSLFVILVLFLAIVATLTIKQNYSAQAPSNNFSYGDTKITTTEASSYESIVKGVVQKHTSNNYVVYVSELHKNGNLLYAQGYFDVPEEGRVNYDVILNDQSPNSLMINGNEYIK